MPELALLEESMDHTRPATPRLVTSDPGRRISTPASPDRKKLTERPPSAQTRRETARRDRRYRSDRFHWPWLAALAFARCDTRISRSHGPAENRANTQTDRVRRATSLHRSLRACSHKRS